MRRTTHHFTTYQKFKKMKRFDMSLKPIKPRFFLRPITWLMAFPEVRKHKLKINKINMSGLKPPYFLLCSHSSFMDFKVTTAAIFPNKANYVVTVDGFINKHWLMRNVGCIYKRKFITDYFLIRHLMYASKHNKSVLVMYPEATFNFVGATCFFPESTGKFAKLFNIPIVTLTMHGNHLQQPIWNLVKRKTVPLIADMKQIVTQEDLKTITSEEINERIQEALTYDDYAWQFENNIHIDYEDRAKGLHSVLYQCPNCKTESKMASDKDRLFCTHCGKEWTMDTLGKLHATTGETEFPHIPDWFEWQRCEVKKQIADGSYKFECDAMLDVLPNAKGFWRLGKVHVTHTIDKGFKVTGEFDGETLLIEKKPLANYSICVDFNYFKKGDVFSFSNPDDTYFFYPIDMPNVVTKLRFGVEELYKYHKSRQFKDIDDEVTTTDKV